MDATGMDMNAMAAFLGQAQASGQIQNLAMMMSMMQPAAQTFAQPAVQNFAQPAAQNFMLPGQNMVTQPAVPGVSPYGKAGVSPMMKGAPMGKGFGGKGGMAMMGMMKGSPYGKGFGMGKGAVPDNETLFVKSLPLEATQEVVHGIFSQYGGVQNVKVLPPSGGRNVVAAFVSMNSVQEAKWILENVNGQVPTGLQNPVEIMFATPKEFSSSWGKGGGAKNILMAGQTIENGQTGTLKAFGQKGYGYITPDDGSEDVFFHLAAVLNGNEMDMIVGQRLKYEMGMDTASGRMKAIKVQIETNSAAPRGAAVPADPVEVEQFLMLNPVEAHAQEKFRAMDPHVQKWVINRGNLDMAITRDPTGALISRMAKLSQVASGQVHVPPGDWVCQNCGDHQFARNVTCRSCGAAKPDNLGITLNPM